MLGLRNFLQGLFACINGLIEKELLVLARLHERNAIRQYVIEHLRNVLFVRNDNSVKESFEPREDVHRRVILKKLNKHRNRLLQRILKDLAQFDECKVKSLRF